MMRGLMENLDAGQRRAVENVREAAARIWSRPLHRHYTDHTVAHSERVIALLDGLTAGMMEGDKRLGPTEVYVLLAAAYLHDIGMQNERFAGGSLENIRAAHNELTAEMIYGVFEDRANAFQIPLARDPGVVEAVALVAKGHRRVDLEDAAYEAFTHGGETVRPRLLAALLRFGDELDIDHRRVDLELMKVLDLPLDSQLHWWKCHYVSGVSIVDEYIRVSYRFPQERPDYAELIVPLVEGEIRAKHAALEGILRGNGVKVALGPPQVRLMRLVQPLPAEVEELARGQEREGAEAQGSRDARGEYASEQGKRAQILGPADTLPPPVRGEGDVASGGREGRVFDQRGQVVGTQINIAGNYVDQRAAGGPAQVPPEPGTTEPAGEWDTAAIRRLLMAAFSDGELTTLCFDYFRPVYEEFGAGMSKGDKVQRLLDYCIRKDQVGRLLGVVRRGNRAQYERFERGEFGG